VGGTLLQFCVLGLSFLKDGNVRICIFPEREEVLISDARVGDFSAVREHGQDLSGQEGRAAQMDRILDERECFRTLSPRLFLVAAANRLGRERKGDGKQSFPSRTAPGNRIPRELALARGNQQAGLGGTAKAVPYPNRY